MTVNNLNNFLDKVMTIEISTINRYLDLSRYRQTSDTAEDIELTQLQQYAITELLMFDNLAIQKQLNRMDQIKQRFKKFWEIYRGAFTEFNNGTLDERLFIEKIKELFIVPNFPYGAITRDFIKDLHDAIMYKVGSLSAFMAQVKLMMDAPEPDQAPRPGNTFIDYLINIDESKKQQFADGIKKQFPGIMGTKLGILLAAMETENCIMLGTKSELYNSLKEFFGWDIGKDEGMNRAIRNISTKNKELEQYREIIRNICKSIV